MPLMLALSWLAHAAEPRRVDELMDKSGLNKQLSQSQAQVRAGLQQAVAEGKANGTWVMGEEDTAMLLRAMTGSFAPGPMKSIVRQEMERLLSADDERVVLEWLSTPLGRRFTRLEEQSAEMDPARLMKDSEAFLQTLPASRVESVRGL